MRFFFVLFAALALVVSSSVSTRADAFVPKNTAFHRRGSTSGTSLSSSSSTSSAAVVEVPTRPIEGMKPGTSGLRKKVEVWQAVDPANQHYVENFIQSLLETMRLFND